MKTRLSIVSSVLLAALALAQGQDVIVRATLDTNRGLIGDQFTLRLLVEKPAEGWQVNFPVVADSLSGKIEVLNIRPVDTAVLKTGHLLTQDLKITVFDTGFFEIPALEFEISHASFSDTLRTLPVGFEILSVRADSTIRDIKGIYKVPLSFREAAPYVLGLAGMALVIWQLILFFRKRRFKIPGKAIEIPSEPPDVIALRELRQLREEKPWLNNRIKYYYSRISEILRTYIERRFIILAMEQTTGEIMQMLRQSNIDSLDLNRLSELLTLADLVKFAKVIPDPEDNALQIGYAEEFVNNSSKVMVVQSDESSEEIVESNRI